MHRQMVMVNVLGWKGGVASRFRLLDLLVSGVGSFGQQDGVATESDVSTWSSDYGSGAWFVMAG